MTSQNVEIQALIDGIDELLSKDTPRLPWVMSDDALQQRQVLEQARQYLASLQQPEANPALPATPPSVEASPFSTHPTSGQVLGQPSGQPSAESAQQVLQAVLQEMNYWRVNMLQPLRTEIEALQHQRQRLSQEVRQLEGRQQALSGTPNLQNQQLLEFLQAAMGQMQANLSGQVTQMMANLPAQASLAASSQSGQAALSAVDRVDHNLLSPAERLAQTRLMQAQSDQLMLKLDSTLQIIFESLNRNVQAYQESMEQGLGRMHHLGQQGEAMFTFLVNRLAQQLGREATSFLQSSPDASTEAPAQVPAQTQSNLPRRSQEHSGAALVSDDSSLRDPGAGSLSSLDSPFKVSDFLSQVPEPRSAASFVPAVPFNLSEEVLDIAGLDDADLPEESLDDLLPDAMLSDRLGAELNQLQLEAIPDPESNLLESVEPFDLFSGTQPLLAATSPTESVPASSDLDSALDLLNQLSAEMQAEMRLGDLGQIYDSSTELSSIELAATSEPVREPEFIATPDSLYDEAFYSNLFQDPVANSAPPADWSGEQANNLTLEQEWFGGLGDPALQQTTQPSADTAAVNSMSQVLESDLVDNQAVNQVINQAENQIAQPESFIQAAATESDFEQTLQALIQEGLPEKVLEAMPVNEAPDAVGLDLGMTLDLPKTPANPPPVTIEGLEGLFEDLPDLLPEVPEKKN